MGEGKDALTVEIIPDHPVLLSSLHNFYKKLNLKLITCKFTNNTEKSLTISLDIKISDLSYSLPDTIEIEPNTSKEWNYIPLLKADEVEKLEQVKESQFEITYRLNGEPEKNLSWPVTLLPRNVIYWAIPHPEKKDEYLSLLDYITLWIKPVDKDIRTTVNTELRDKDSPLQLGYRQRQNALRLFQNIYNLIKKKMQYMDEPIDAALLEYHSHGAILQAIQLPTEMLRQGPGNCIDIAVLYASFLEAAWLDAMIVFKADIEEISADKGEIRSKFTNGHALVGWRKEKDSDEYEFLETTVIDRTDFSSAVREGNNTYKRYEEQGLFDHPPLGSESFAYRLPVKETYDKLYGISRKVSRPSTSTPPTEGAGEDELVPESIPEFLGTGNHFAVVVGAKSYDAEDVYNQNETCPYDAETFYQELVVNSFHPSRLRFLIDDSIEPLSNEHIQSCLKKLAKETKAQDLLLFYYSGAIKQERQKHLLVTLDMQVGSSALSLEQVRDCMVQAKARAKVLLLDIYTIELNVQDPDVEQRIKKFMNTLLEQLKELAVLASYKEEDKEYASSLFTQALIEELQQLPGSGKRLTVQDIYKSVSNNEIPLYPAEPYRAEQIIVCSSGQESRSYFLLSYQYLIDMQKTLERVQSILQEEQIVKSDILRAINILELLVQKERPEIDSGSAEELRLLDKLFLFWECVRELMEEEMQSLLGHPDARIPPGACRIATHTITSLLSEVLEKAEQLRETITPDAV